MALWYIVQGLLHYFKLDGLVIQFRVYFPMLHFWNFVFCTQPGVKDIR
jgi:hypothetical protein